MSTDPIIQAALDRLRELSDERRRLELFIDMHRKLAERLRAETAHPKVIQPLSTLSEPQDHSLPENRQHSSSADILNGIRMIMREYGKPVSLADLHNGLIRLGVSIPGKDPRNNLSQKLSSSTEFFGQRGVGWYFKDYWAISYRAQEGDDTNSEVVVDRNNQL